ncbi:hypothetical protein C8J56DRAFT_107164 [Mycena floridula]|nr:hypothetical protein C8J56DRAFT_107164 [Mycena floridula]
MPSGPPGPAQIYGPILIGAFLSTVLYGVSLVQMFIYYRTAKRDPLWMRLLVLYLLIAETANTGFNIALVYEPLILKFGEKVALVTSPVFLRADGAVTVAISTPVQLFMAWRIKALTGSMLAAAGIGLLAVVACAGGIATSVFVTLKPNFQQFNQFTAAPSTWLIASAVCDVAIAVLLFYALSKKKSGFADMDDYITRIMLITVQTGALTAVAALADAIVFVSIKESTIFFSWDLSLSKLYTNTLLSSLNARNSWYNFNGPRKGPNALFATSESSTFNNSRANVRMSHHIAPSMKPNDIELGDFKSPSQHEFKSPPNAQQQQFASFVPSPNAYGKQSYGNQQRNYDGIRVTNEVIMSHK